MTAKQREVARLLCLGLSTKQIARRVGRSVDTVQRVLARAYARTQVGSQFELVGWCVAHGVITVAELQEVYGQPPGDRIA